MISPIGNSERLLSPLERRTMFSRKVFCGATSPLRPPAIPAPHAVWDQCEDEDGSCLKAAYMILARVKSPIQDIKHRLLVPPPPQPESPIDNISVKRSSMCWVWPSGIDGDICWGEGELQNKQNLKISQFTTIIWTPEHQGTATLLSLFCAISGCQRL